MPEHISFNDFNTKVQTALIPDIMRSYAHLMPKILEHIRVLLWNGQDDLIVNTPQAETWIKNIDWPGKQGYYEADKIVWKVGGNVAGYVRGYENLH